MRILWSIHLYPPVHNAGAEYVAHTVNKYLLKRGHEVRVLLHQGDPYPYTYEGVQVFGPPTRNGRVAGFPMEAYAWGDVICTHLDFSPHSVNMGRVNSKPVIHFVHNDCPYPCIQKAKRKQYPVYNSQWIADKLNPLYGLPSMVLNPPCDSLQYRITEDPSDNEYITLININENKGGYVLYNLARAMPDRKFLAVIGSYEDGGRRPDIMTKLRTLANVVMEEQTADARAIYARTRILLVPSRYESWGRVATEAMLNGIPVIACATEGLKENCGNAAIYAPARGKVERDREGTIVKCDEDYDTGSIKDSIELLDYPDMYNCYSSMGLRRADELEYQRINQLNQLENFLHYAQRDYKDNAI